MSNDETAGGCSGGEFMLFGVRVVVDSMRKSVSLNNLSDYEHKDDLENKDAVVAGNIATGYASADDVIHHSSTITNAAVNRERKRGVPWTEDEHKLFLSGLQKLGKGDWRGISKNFVKTRTPTQVASHAQKYFIRRTNLNRRRRRSSLFDITTDSVAANNTTDDQMMLNENTTISQSQSPPPPSQPQRETIPVKFSVSPPTPIYHPFTSHINYAVVLPPYSSSPSSSNKSMMDFDLNNLNSNSNSNSSSAFDPSPALSLNLSLSMSIEPLYRPCKGSPMAMA